MHHAQIEYYGELFERHGLSRYMNFNQFLQDPERFLEEYDGLEGQRPLLPEQKRVIEKLEHESAQLSANRDELEQLGGGLLDACSDLEKRLDDLPRVNGKPFEKIRHHRHLPK